MILTHGAPDQLAALFAGLKALSVVDRELHSAILRRALEANPRYLGVWAVWEPDALDGKDADFVNATGHDATGRFLPVWHRRFGGIHVEANIASNDPKRGAYYMLPTRMRRSVMVGPYEYPMGGQSVLIVTLASPILVNGQCLGAAGVDFSLEDLAVQAMENPSPATRQLIETMEREMRHSLIFTDPRGARAWGSTTARQRLRHFVPAETWAGGALPPALAQLYIEKTRTSPRRPFPEVLLQQNNRSIRVRLVQSRRAGAAVLLVEDEAAPTPSESLSRREREVMDWLSEGKSNDEIAIILGISPHTVKNHLDRIFKKLCVDHRHAAATLWRTARDATTHRLPPGSGPPPGL
ncbi:MAG: Methyl-accepting chemotaxis protein [Verrucomicrobiales bacterium]|nr:Methyl-accepting chemotaxis protein [Verrucomicrobiales bacterium]